MMHALENFGVEKHFSGKVNFSGNSDEKGFLKSRESL